MSTSPHIQDINKACKGRQGCELTRVTESCRRLVGITAVDVDFTSLISITPQVDVSFKPSLFFCWEELCHPNSMSVLIRLSFTTWIKTRHLFCMPIHVVLNPLTVFGTDPSFLLIMYTLDKCLVSNYTVASACSACFDSCSRL